MKIFFKGLFPAIGIVIFLILAGGSFDTTTKAKKDSSSEKKETTSNSQSETKKKEEIFKIGDSINLDKVVYTVNGTRESEGSGFLKPKEGNKFFLVDVTVENKSNESKAISSMLMFKLQDSQSYNYNITIFTDQKGSLDGEIAYGGKLRGEVTFEIPKSETTLKLDVDPSIFGTGKFVVDLSKK